MVEQPKDRAATPQVSRLAIGGLVLAALPLCPPLNLVGALVGMIAARRIRAAPQRRSGRRLAIAAVIVGWVSSIVWSAGWWWAGDVVQRGLRDSMIEAVRRTIDEGSERPEAVRAAVWVDAADTPSAEALRVFADEVHRRYGEPHRITVSSLAADGSVTRPSYSIAMVLYFADRSQRLGAARFVTVPGTVRVRLRRLTVVDPDAGDLVLGAAAGDEGDSDAAAAEADAAAVEGSLGDRPQAHERGRFATMPDLPRSPS